MGLLVRPQRRHRHRLRQRRQRARHQIAAVHVQAVVLAEAPESEGLPVVALDVLVLLKLQAGRRHDLDDVARLLETADVEHTVRKYIVSHAPELVGRLDLALGELKP